PRPPEGGPGISHVVSTADGQLATEGPRSGIRGSTTFRQANASRRGKTAAGSPVLLPQGAKAAVGLQLQPRQRLHGPPHLIRVTRPGIQGVPELHGAVVAAGDNTAAVEEESSAPDRLAME